MTYDKVAEQLLASVPEFKETYDEHLKDYDGKLLLHVLFADLTPFVVQQYRLSMQSGRDHVTAADVFHRILNFIEDAAHSDDEDVTTLVQVSFLEGLHQAGPDYNGLIAHLGPASRKMLANAEEGWVVSE